MSQPAVGAGVPPFALPFCFVVPAWVEDGAVVVIGEVGDGIETCWSVSDPLSSDPQPKAAIDSAASAARAISLLGRIVFILANLSPEARPAAPRAAPSPSC